MIFEDLRKLEIELIKAFAALERARQEQDKIEQLAAELDLNDVFLRRDSLIAAMTLESLNGQKDSSQNMWPGRE